MRCTVLLCNDYCSHKIIFNLSSWLWPVWSHDKGVLCRSTDSIELKHRKQLFCKLRVQLMHIKHCQKFFSVCGDHVVKWNLSFCKWWQHICIPLSISLLQWRVCFVFAFFHTPLTTYKNLSFKYGKLNFFFIPRTMATLGPFFQKFRWTSCRPFLLSPCAKNPLSSPPPPKTFWLQKLKIFHK